MRNSDTADPFDTEQIRARVMDAWRATPARFREDANTEEDFALGGYRDRLLVELLQNASDAAGAAGEPGRVRIELRSDRLVVANTGQPLDSEAVASLATMRASAKRDDLASVGRFGVGFAAVLSVSDEPAVLSRDGGVRFSAARTAAHVLDEAALGDELRRRGGHVPVLRLPFPEDKPPPDGFDTAVVLGYRDERAGEVVTALVDRLDSTLLLALPGLARIDVVREDGAVRTLLAERTDGLTLVADDGLVTAWRTVTRSGDLPASLLADRPTEEQRRTGWSVTWALPVDDRGHPVAMPAAVEAVLHAPTPTAEPLGLAALLIAGFPLDPSRRHVAPSGVTDFLVDRAAVGFVELVEQVAVDVGAEVLDLVPRPALVGTIDTALRRAVVEALAGRPLAQPASGDELLAPARSVVLDPSSPKLVAVLGDLVSGLVAQPWTRARVLVEVLGATSLPLADVIEQLGGVDRDPSWWRELYDALSTVDVALLDGLPVPLIDGRVVRGARTCVLPEGDPNTLSALGLRVVHPAAAHPLLTRLGARPGQPRAVLADPELHARLREWPDETDRYGLVRAVLALVDEAGLRAGDEPALGALRVPTQGGYWTVATEAVLPGSALAALAASDVPVVDVTFAGEVGASALAAVGVLAAVTAAVHHDVITDADTLNAVIVDGELWAERVAALAGVPDLAGAIVPELSVVHGLEVVREQAWSDALPMLSAPEVRRAIVEPVAVVLGHGERVLAPSLAGWWLSDVQLFGAFTPRQCRLAGDDRLVGIFEPIPSDVALDTDLLTALGVTASVEQLLGRPGGADELLERLVEPDAHPSAESLHAIYRALAATAEPLWPEPPEQLLVVDGEQLKVVAAEDVTVVVAPHHAVFAAGPAIAGPPALAQVLDLATTSTAAAAVDVGGGVERPVPSPVCDRMSDVTDRYVEHDELVVAGTSVEWWVNEDGRVHAATVAGLARGLAWSSGQWWRRWEIAALLADPERSAQDAIERAFDVDR